MSKKTMTILMFSAAACFSNPTDAANRTACLAKCKVRPIPPTMAGSCIDWCTGIGGAGVDHLAAAQQVFAAMMAPPPGVGVPGVPGAPGIPLQADVPQGPQEAVDSVWELIKIRGMKEKDENYMKLGARLADIERHSNTLFIDAFVDSYYNKQQESDFDSWAWGLNLFDTKSSYPKLFASNDGRAQRAKQAQKQQIAQANQGNLDNLLTMPLPEFKKLVERKPALALLKVDKSDFAGLVKQNRSELAIGITELMTPLTPQEKGALLLFFIESEGLSDALTTAVEGGPITPTPIQLEKFGNAVFTFLKDPDMNKSFLDQFTAFRQNYTAERKQYGQPQYETLTKAGLPGQDELIAKPGLLLLFLEDDTWPNLKGLFTETREKFGNVYSLDEDIGSVWRHLNPPERMAIAYMLITRGRAIKGVQDELARRNTDKTKSRSDDEPKRQEDVKHFIARISSSLNLPAGIDLNAIQDATTIPTVTTTVTTIAGPPPPPPPPGVAPPPPPPEPVKEPAKKPEEKPKTPPGFLEELKKGKKLKKVEEK